MNLSVSSELCDALLLMLMMMEMATYYYTKVSSFILLLLLESVLVHPPSMASCFTHELKRRRRIAKIGLLSPALISKMFCYPGAKKKLRGK